MNIPLPPLFPQDQVPIIVQDVLDCCKNLTRPGPKVKRPEDTISKEIFLRLTRILRYRSGPLIPHMESWLSDAAHRADIRFTGTGGIETYFLFEAKRLFITYPKNKRKESLIKEYIHEGIMRFVRGDYAPFQNRSAMLGYVHDESLAAALQKLACAIKAEGQTLMLKQDLSVSALAVSPEVFETHHALRGRDFLLYHLLVSIPAS